MKKTQEERPGLAATIALVAILVPLTGVSQFYRNSIGVAATTIARDLDLRPDQLGWVASMFFLTFGASQIPVGILIDRYGPRRAIIGASLILVLGALTSFLANSYGVLLLSRALLALGCSTFFVGPLIIYSRLYGGSLFSTFAALQLGLGSLGTLIATGPLAYGVQAFGWRLSYLVPGLAAFILAGGAFFLLKRHPKSDVTGLARETLRETLAGVAEAAKVRDFPALFLLQFACYSVVGVIVGLWGAPFLAHTFGVDLSVQGLGMMAVAFAYVIAVLAIGPLDRLIGSYKIPVSIGVGGATAILILLALFAPLLGFYGAIASFVALVICLGVTPIFTAHGRALFPPHLTGRGLTLINVGVMGGAFTMQTLSGFLIRFVAGEAKIYPLTAYRLVFAMEAGLMLCAFALYLTTRDPLRPAKT